jgi:hypothetical protein
MLNKRDFGAVRDHDEPLPHSVSDQPQSRHRIVSAASSGFAGGGLTAARTLRLAREAFAPSLGWYAVHYEWGLSRVAIRTDALLAALLIGTLVAINFFLVGI